MGITGLIPFLEKASTIVNIKKFEGSSVAVDSYCWLHKGVFACAEKLIRGEETNIHIKYCLKYVDMLLSYKFRIIMVFDGRHLPAKAETERRRRKARNESKQLAKEFLRRNELEKARSHMRRAVDVTHEMALILIKACRDRGVDCIVAPYEADAQMAWLNKLGLAEYIITEDSDLTLFGAQKILFKLDLTGQAVLVENTKLYLAMGCRPEKYTFEKFRRMCILSGCDYLDSLHGIGLKKACKFVLTTDEEDMKKALKKIPSYLKMKQLEVTDEYIESFLKAEATFRHMFIYNPLEKKMERLYELDEYQTNEYYCSNAGSLLDSEQAYQLALGNLDPITLNQIDEWNPYQDFSQNKLKHKSIWISSKKVFEHGEKTNQAKSYNATQSESIIYFKKIEFKNMAETEIAEKLLEEKSKLEESEIFCMYKYSSPKLDRKRKRQQSLSSSDEDEKVEKLVSFSETSKKHIHNPFAKPNSAMENLQTSPVCTNNSLLKLLSPKKSNSNMVDQQSSEFKHSVKSRFFAENVKMVKSPFVARDLTSEMLKIEKKTNEYMEQQQHLYDCSSTSPKKKIVENKQSQFENELTDNSDQTTFVESVKYASEASALDTKYSKSFQEDKSLESFGIKKKTILNSDFEKNEFSPKFFTVSPIKKFSKTMQKPKVMSSKIKEQTNLGKVDPKQPKLIMFGFQKKPSLKKL